MTNCIKQIISCMIQNESHGHSCGIIEIIPLNHFILIPSTNVHTCSAHITPEECTYKQRGTGTRGKYPEGKKVSLCLFLTVPYAFSLRFVSCGEGTAGQAGTRGMLLSSQLFWRWPWGAAPNTYAEHYCSVQVSCRVDLEGC